MNIAKPPYEHHCRPKYADHKNKAVNLDVVATISIGRERYYPDNNGIPTIDFTFIGGKEKHSWYMYDDDSAEKHYKLLTNKEWVAIDALQQVTGCPFTVDSATVPKIGISEAPPYQVVVVLSMAWTRLKQIRQTLEKLTKGENK